MTLQRWVLSLLFLFCVSAMSANALINNAVIHYALNESSGTVANDTSGNGYNGTYQSATMQGAAGVIGTAATFDGTTNYITLPTPAKIGGNVSYSVWYKPADTVFCGTGYCSLMEQWAGGNRNHEVGIYQNKTYFKSVSTDCTTADASQVVGTVSMTNTSKWYHIIYTRGGVTNGLYNLTTYIDGVNVGSIGTGGGGCTITGTVYLGQDPAASAKLKGGLDEFTIYNHFITQSEALQIYGNESTGHQYNYALPPASTGTILVAALQNTIMGVNWNQAVNFTNVTGTLTLSYFNITAVGFCVTYTGNGTNTSCTATGSGASTYFNTSTTSVVTGSATVTASTYDALLLVNATQLYTGTQVSTFNVTNNKTTNTTTTTTLLIPAIVGNNTLLMTVAGNYTPANFTCTGVQLTITACGTTGIYDDLFTIGMTNTSSHNSVSTFSIRIINDTLSLNTLGNTTTGNVTFTVLQGYYYTFIANATGLNLANITIPANASTNRYNFSVGIANTFNMTFLNESTNSPLLNTTITIQLISDAFSANYTTNTSSFVVSELPSGSYDIRYWNDPSVPRDYYLTLVEQSSNTLSLYIVDVGISNLYLPIVVNENSVPTSNVTVMLLRQYILSNNTAQYNVVQMAKTDTNGQAVLRVVPNIIDYKLIMSDGTHILQTTPTKLTSSTNTYTLNTKGNPVTSLVEFPNIATSLTFNATGKVFTYTWTDPNSIVSFGCLRINKFKAGVQSTYSNTCVAGGTGSITSTITDTNNTQYTAISTIKTNTEFSTKITGTTDVNYSTTWATFGIVGFFIAFIIFLAFIILGGETGIAGMLVSGVVALLFLVGFGFLAGTPQVLIGVIIIVGIIVYKLRS